MRKWIMGLGMMAGLMIGAQAKAVLIPETGSYRGVYHRDFQGVGRFSGFLVSPDLLDQFKEYEGKDIQLEVDHMEQIRNPGPGVIEKIGQIVVLEDDQKPSLELSVKTREEVVAGRGFEVLVTAKSTRKEGFYQRDILGQLNLSVYQPSEKLEKVPEQPSEIKGYTNRQLEKEVKTGEYGASLKPFPGGQANLVLPMYQPRLHDGETWTWVIYYPEKFVRTDGELGVTVQSLVEESALGMTGQGKYQPVEGWGKLSVAKRPTTRPSGPALGVERVVMASSGLDGWTQISFHIKPAEGKSVVAPTLTQRDGETELPNIYAVIGRLEAFDDAGKAIEMRVERLDKPANNVGEAKMVKLPEGGFDVKAQFKPEDPKAKIKTMTASFVTEGGVETVKLAGN